MFLTLERIKTTTVGTVFLPDTAYTRSTENTAEQESAYEYNVGLCSLKYALLTEKPESMEEQPEIILTTRQLCDRLA